MIKERVQPGDRGYIRSMRKAAPVWIRAVSCIAFGLPGSLQAAGGGPEPIEPLIVRADLSIAKGEFVAAAESLREATTIIRRNSGLYDLRQYDLLLKLVDVQSQIGELDAAAADLSYLQRLSENGHGVDSLQHGRALTEIGGWQCRIGQFMQSRETHRASIHILEQQGATEPLIEALRGLATCCLQELSSAGVATSQDSLDSYRGPIVRSTQFSPSNPAFRMHVFRYFRIDGEEALQRAVKLSSALEPKAQLELLLQAGDWFLGKDYVREARHFYARADALARASGTEDALMVPTQVLYPMPPSALRTRHLPAADVDEQFVEVEFTVRGDGHIIDEKVIERGSGKSIVLETLSALRAARYRPRIVQGRTQLTEGVRFRQGFRRLKDLQANAE